MTAPTARDVDLNDWLNGIGSHPADTMAKQAGHQLVRELVANVGSALHDLLPPGRDKSLTFKLLEDVLMRSNRALALGGGPVDQSDEAVDHMRRAIAASDVGLPRDHRYEAEQRGDTHEEVEGVPAAETGWQDEAPVDDVTVYRQPGRVLLQTGASEPVELDGPDEVELVRVALLGASRQAWPV